jgi:hypothetical protein
VLLDVGVEVACVGEGLGSFGGRESEDWGKECGAEGKEGRDREEHDGSMVVVGCV